MASLATDIAWREQPQAIAVEQGSSMSAPNWRCVVCGCDVLSHPYLQTVPWLASCQNCSIGVSHPQANDAELAAIYGEDYYETFGFEAKEEADYRALRQATISRFIKIGERFCKAPGRLLDVGSGIGDTLAVGRSRGWDVRGVEPNRCGVAAAENVAPGATIDVTFEELPCGEGAFELITCLDVLEHLRRPDLALQKMHALLVARGVVLLALPDAGSLAARLLGPRWPHYHRDHLWYFTKATLRRLLEKCGFEVLHQGQCWKAFNLKYILGILAEHPHTGFLHRGAVALKDRMPRWLMNARWPLVPEGQLAIARKTPL